MHDAPVDPGDPESKGVVILLLHLAVPIAIEATHGPQSLRSARPLQELQEVLQEARGLIPMLVCVLLPSLS